MKTGDKKLAVGYVRVSTSSEDQKTSIPNQKERVQSYCKSRDWKLVEFFEDQGFSGKDLERRAFGELKRFIKKEGVDALVVTNLDRFSRDPRDVIAEMDWLKDREVDFVSIDQSIDTSTTAGEMVMVLISYLNRMEREKTVEKIERAIKQKKERGEPLGRPPFGLQYSEDKTSFVPKGDGKFQKALEAIELREEGASFPEIEKKVGISTSTASRLVGRKGVYEKLDENGT